MPCSRGSLPLASSRPFPASVRKSLPSSTSSTPGSSRKSNEGGVTRPRRLIRQSARTEGAEHYPKESHLRIWAQFATAIAAHFATDDSGQDVIEYALLTAIIGVSGVLIFSTLSTTMGAAYSSWNTAG